MKTSHSDSTQDDDHDVEINSNSNSEEVPATPQESSHDIEESEAVTSNEVNDDSANQQTESSNNNSYQNRWQALRAARESNKERIMTQRKKGEASINNNREQSPESSNDVSKSKMADSPISASNDTNSNMQTGEQLSSSSLKDGSQSPTPLPSSYENIQGDDHELLGTYPLPERALPQPPQSPSESLQDDDHDLPGAYPVSGRAPGTFPAWGRRGRGISRVVEQIRASIFTASAIVVEEDEKEPLPTVYPTDIRTAESIRRKRRKLFLLMSVLVCSLVGLIVALVVTQVGKKSHTGRNIESWAERKSLRCGVPFSTEGLGVKDMESGDYHGFDVDMCYAVAAALFGESFRDRVTFFGKEMDFDFSALAEKEVDLLAKGRTHTMERQIYLDQADAGFTFSVPYFYSSLAFAGEPSFISCIESRNVTGHCTQLKICVRAQTTHRDVVKIYFPEVNIVEVDVSVAEFYGYLKTPSCNILTGEPFYFAKNVMKEKGVTGPYEVSSNIFSKEPLAMVTRSDEPQWSDFVNWVLQGLMVAEQHNITQHRANEMPTTIVFGERFKNMFIDAVKAVGNYGEIYSRHMEDIVPRRGMNLINNGSSGLIYSHPFGNFKAPPYREEDGILKEIRQRGYLRCGIVVHDFLGRNSTERSGLGPDYCYALAAGIFQYDLDATNNNRTATVAVRSAEIISLLYKRDVDVISLVPVNLVNDVTGNLSFSQPIYYDIHGAPFALATCQNDVQWSSFVYWAVSATFYAEENNITQASSSKMPLLSILSPHHKWMLRDIINAIGNYGEIYERNNDSLRPRADLNLLNSMGGPQLYPFPGFF